MSVLIEALCLVVNRLSLELSFPNGADGFEAQANGMEAVRYVVSDDDVIAVSVLDPAHLESLLVPLTEAGLVYTDADGTGDFVFVDMELGATGPCTWLKTEPHQHGFRTALLSGAVGDDYMVTPAGWSPQQSWNLQRYDLRDAGPERVFPLGHDEAGEEAVLDFETVRVISGPDERSPIVTVGEPTLPSPPAPAVDDVRLAAAQRLLGEKGIPYRLDTVAKEIAVLFALDDVPGGEAGALPGDSHVMPAKSYSNTSNNAPDEGDEGDDDTTYSSTPFTCIVEQLAKSRGVSADDRQRAPTREQEQEIERMFQPESLISREGRLRIVLSAHTDENSLCYNVSLPCVLQTIPVPERLKRGVAGELHADFSSRTVSVTIIVSRLTDEDWERAVERGYAAASATGSRAARQLSVWSRAWSA